MLSYVESSWAFEYDTDFSALTADQKALIRTVFGLDSTESYFFNEAVSKGLKINFEIGHPDAYSVSRGQDGNVVLNIPQEAVVGALSGTYTIEKIFSKLTHESWHIFSMQTLNLDVYILVTAAGGDAVGAASMHVYEEGQAILRSLEAGDRVGGAQFIAANFNSGYATWNDVQEEWMAYKNSTPPSDYVTLWPELSALQLRVEQLVRDLVPPIQGPEKDGIPGYTNNDRIIDIYDGP